MRGLGNCMKRKCLYKYFQDKNLDIIFFQETHGTAKLNKEWQKESGYHWFSSSGSSGARGVSILFTRKVFNNIENIKSY